MKKKDNLLAQQKTCLAGSFLPASRLGQHLMQKLQLFWWNSVWSCFSMVNMLQETHMIALMHELYGVFYEYQLSCKLCLSYSSAVYAILCSLGIINTLRQNGHHFPDILKWIFLKENVWISIKNFIEVCSEGSNYQYSSIGSDNGLVPSRGQAIIWTNDDLLTHVWVTRPQWVKELIIYRNGLFVLPACYNIGTWQYYNVFVFHVILLYSQWHPFSKLTFKEEKMLNSLGE